MSVNTLKLIAIAIAFSFCITGIAVAAGQPAPLSAKQSDPQVMGWMQGFPHPRINHYPTRFQLFQLSKAEMVCLPFA